MKVVKLLAWFRFSKRRRFERAIRTLDDFILRVVDERRRNQIDNGDLVSLLLWARDEQTGESMTDRQIRDELMTMLQAGNDTSPMPFPGRGTSRPSTPRCENGLNWKWIRH